MCAVLKKKKRPVRASDHPQLKFAKGPTREQRKRGKRQHHAEVVAATRELVFRLDPVCIVCARGPFGTDEMHEVIPRSQTRGLEPERRFNRRICVRLCRVCHRDVTEKRVRMKFADESKGVDGGVWISASRDVNIVGRGWVHFYRRATRGHEGQHRQETD